MGCGTSFVKYVLFFCNLIFALCGLIILGLGVAVKLQLSDVTRILEGKIDTPPVLFIVIGSIIFIIAFFGCCGAVRESHCMIVTYAVSLLVIIIIQVVLAILIFVYMGDFEKAVTESLRRTFDDARAGGEASKEAFDTLQSKLQCCGLQGPYDYPTGSTPNSCCSGDSTLEKVIGICSPINSYQNGCVESLKRFTKTAGNTIAGVAIGVAVAEVVGAIFALCLANSIRNADRSFSMERKPVNDGGVLLAAAGVQVSLADPGAF